MTISSRPDAASVDSILRALADQHCRLVVRYLADSHETAVSFREISQFVAANAATDPSPHDVRIHLSHAVLPRLDETNIVEYDLEAETVRYRRRPVVESVLAAVET